MILHLKTDIKEEKDYGMRKKMTIPTCKDLAGDHGAQRRDEQRGFVGEEEEERKGEKREEHERK